MKVNVLIILFVILSLTSCGIPSRLKTSAIIQDVEKFRDAEQIYKDKYGSGSFGTVNQLIENKLLETRFADLEEHGYRFNVTVENAHYNLTVVPEAEENKSPADGDEELSLFVDESGTIRVSVKPNTPATSKSSPINPK